MEKLIYLFTNPYTWLFIVLIFVLPSVLIYIRRFYPEKLQQQMAEEEACILEINTKPEMKQMRRNVSIGFVLSLFISLLVAYYYESLEIFKIVFISLMGLVAIYSMLVEYKINKNKTCNHISVKYYIAMLAIIFVITFVVILVFKK